VRVAVSIRTVGQNCRDPKATQQEMQKVSVQHAKSMFLGIQILAPQNEAAPNIDLLSNFGDVRNLHKEGVIQESISIQIKSGRLE
jgi:hypothetical protein